MTNHKRKRKLPKPVDVDPDTLDGSGFWLFSDHDLNGGYTPSVAFGPDDVFPINDPTAYAEAVTRVAVTAQHDSSVTRLLHEYVGIPLELVADVLLLLRDGNRARPAVEVLPGLTMTPVVSGRTLEPFIHIHVKGEQTSQNTVPEMLDHARGALEVSAAAKLDTRLFREVVNTLGMDSARAGAIVAHLSAFWPGRTAEADPP